RGAEAPGSEHADNQLDPVRQHDGQDIAAPEPGRGERRRHREHAFGEGGVVQYHALVGDAGSAGVSLRPLTGDFGCCHGTPLPFEADAKRAPTAAASYAGDKPGGPRRIRATMPGRRLRTYAAVTTSPGGDAHDTADKHRQRRDAD